MIISARDDASSVLKTIGGSLDGIGDKAVKLGTSMTLLTAPIAGFLGTALKQAAEQEDALSQLNAVIKSTGGVAGVTAQAADELSSALSKVTRFSDDAVLGAENMLLTFTSIGKDIFPQATKTALDMSQALGQDLKSSSIQLGKALNDPITGITALRRVGVQFTDQQQEQIKVMVESGNLMQAQKTILAELAREFGGSAEAAGKTFAGSLDILNHKFGEFQEKIGFILMPLVQRFTDLIGRAVDTVTEWSNKNPTLTRTIVAIAAGLVAVGPVLIGVGGAIKVVTEATKLFNIALFALTSPIGLVVAAIAGLALAYSTNFLGIRDTVQPVLEQLGKGFQAVGDVIGVTIERFKSGGLKEAVVGLFAVFEDGSSTISKILQAFGIGQQAADDFAQKIADAFAVIRPLFETALSAVEYFVKGFAVNLNDLVFHAVYVFSSLWDKIRPSLQPIIDWFTGSGSNSLSGAISSVGTFIQTQIVEPFRGIWVAIQPALNSIKDWFTTTGWPLIQRSIQLVVDLWDRLKSAFQNFWNDIQPALAPILQGLKAIFQPVIDIINQALDSWEILRRLGNGAPLRTLPGESSPGVASTTPSAGYRADAGMGGILGQNVQSLLSLLSGQSGVANPIRPAAYTAGAIAGQLFSGVRSNYGGSGTPFNNVGTAFGGSGGGQYRASGGPVSANSPYIVGERGPEVFIPSSNGSIAPNGSVGGSRFTWTGNLIVPPNSTVNITRDDIFNWMDAWAEEAGIYG